jgi:hypothetical protein
MKKSFPYHPLKLVFLVFARAYSGKFSQGSLAVFPQKLSKNSFGIQPIQTWNMGFYFSYFH